MDHAPPYRRLLRDSVVVLFVAAAAVAFCYFFVDRPVAHFVHNNHVSQYRVLEWLTLPPPVVQALAPAVLAALLVRRAWGPFRHWERTLLAAGVAIIVADQFRESLSFLFGRYWPDTWTNNNPSLIQNDAYGFHPFHGGSWYGSFPSGHTARTTAVAAALWVGYPRLLWLGVLAVLTEAVGLIGMNYHFVGDVVGGATVGGLVGVYTAHGCGAAHQPSSGFTS